MTLSKTQQPEWDTAGTPRPQGCVSVVIAVRDGERYIAETVRSVLAQGPAIREVIVVDDGSRDDSAGAALAVSDGRVLVIRIKARGVSAARNIGVMQARGDWLYFIDADDLVRRGAIDALLRAARENPEAGLVYGDYDRVTREGRPAGRRSTLMRNRMKPSGDVLEALVQKNCMVLGSQIVQRGIFEQCGGFDEGLRVAEDWHFWCKAAAIAPFHFVPGLCVMSYRVHHDSAIHARPLPFEALRPGIEAVFSEPSILKRLDPGKVAALRRRAEAAQWSYAASVAARRRRFAEGIGMVMQSIRRDPPRAPRALAQFAGAFIGL